MNVKEGGTSRIAKNTLLLYVRMLCVMVVSLYTSRVVLAALGVDDFSLYQVVGGIVGLLSLVTGVLSTGSSRFLTFELGRGDFNKLQATFSTLLIVHITLALLIVIIGEPIGLWFISERLNIPEGKSLAAVVAFQASLINSVVSVVQVPFMAAITAREDLKIYAYIGVVETFAKLAIAFLISATMSDRLIVYAGLLCLVQIGFFLFYWAYCRCHYEESQLVCSRFDWSIIRRVGGFSGWSIFAAVSIALMNHGTILLLNQFFSASIVASRTVALQVNTAANQLLQNFRIAANPQIVKRYAVEDYAGSRRLLLKTTWLSYYLMLLVALPVFFLADPLLRFWLKDVPELATPFLQWSMIQSLFSVFDTSFYMALYAKGQLRENALISPTIGFLSFSLIFYLFFSGASAMVVNYIFAAVYAILGLIVKPVLLWKIVSYPPREIIGVFIRCALVTAVSVPFPYIVTKQVELYSISGFLEICVCTTASVVLSSIFVGMNQAERNVLWQLGKRTFGVAPAERTNHD